MHTIEHLSGQLRSLRLNSLSQAAGNLIAQAEENELSYTNHTKYSSIIEYRESKSEDGCQ